MSGQVKRAVTRYFGGKWAQSTGIIREFPSHDLYCEPFAGGASVLMRKEKVPYEVIADLNSDLLSVFFVLRHPTLSEMLRELVELTPYSLREFSLACEPMYKEDVVEQARRFVVRHAMGMAIDSSVTTGTSTGFRSHSTAQRAPVKDWVSWPSHIASWRERLRGVIIECAPAITTMRRHDRVDALHYVDPPYMHATRKAKKRGYAFEMSVDEHVELLDCLKSLDGMVALSGYRSALYDEMLVGWERVDRAVKDQVGNDRVECLWLSPSLVERREREAMPLFAEAV